MLLSLMDVGLQSGKTFVLTAVLPAIVRANKQFGAGGKHEAVWLAITFSSITAQMVSGMTTTG